MAKKKHPTDYPQFSFRVSDNDKRRINELASEVLAASNTTLDSSAKVFRKNDVLVDALYLGLLTLKKKGMKLTRF
jgi:hypothetical protein